jgi:hypothetical protein
MPSLLGWRVAATIARSSRRLTRGSEPTRRVSGHGRRRRRRGDAEARPLQLSRQASSSLLLDLLVSGLRDESPARSENAAGVGRSRCHRHRRERRRERSAGARGARAPRAVSEEPHGRRERARCDCLGPPPLADVGPRSLRHERLCPPARVFTSGSSPPILGESTDSPPVVGSRRASRVSSGSRRADA